MLLQTYRDERHSRHFDLVGHNWSIDLVTITASGILVAEFACAEQARALERPGRFSRRVEP